MISHPLTSPAVATRRAASLEKLEPRRLLASVMVADIGAGGLHSNPSEFTLLGETLFFIAESRASGVSGTFWELYRTDGTAAGTERLTPIDGTTPGSNDAHNSAELELSVYTGPRSLVAVGEDLWYYDVRHSSAQLLLVKLVRRSPGGETTEWDLGDVNLSLGQRLHDIKNVDGQVHVYRDGDEFSLDPDRKRSRWWKIDDAGELVPTSTRTLSAIKGAGPNYSKSVVVRDKRFHAFETAESGRELWLSDNPTLSRGILRVFGADSADDLLITRRATNPTRLNVALNGFATSFRFADVTRIQIDLGGGDDRAVVSEDGGQITTPVSLFGGAGDDTLQAASGRDTIYAGTGNDALYGGSGLDYLFGEAGNDRLLGGGGRDVLRGSEGRDTFVRSSLLERRDFLINEDLLA